MGSSQKQVEDSVSLFKVQVDIYSCSNFRVEPVGVFQCFCIYDTLVSRKCISSKGRVQAFLNSEEMLHQSLCTLGPSEFKAVGEKS